MHVLDVRGLRKRYINKEYWWSKNRVHEVVKNVNIKIRKGSCLGLVGESGCGKTTLGRMIAGIETHDSGEILIDGMNITNASRKKLPDIRRNVQMVFQDCIGSVNPRHTAGTIISEPAANFLKIGKAELEILVDELLKTVGLNSNDRYKYAGQFSGGQIQRICIARALSVKPRLIILDEPLSSLDVSVQAQILNLLADLKNEFHLSYLFISHDIEAVYFLSDAVAVMYLGTIMEYIDDISLFGELCHPYTKRLLSSVLVADPNKKNIVESVYTEPIKNAGSYTGCPYAIRCEKSNDICFSKVPELKSISSKHQVFCHFI